MKKFDVIVVGAGPAGSTAARFCSEAGLKSAIIEKEKLPRVKACAGGVIPAGLRFCNIDLPDDLIENKCDKIKLSYKRYRRIVKIQEPIYMVERSRFDMFLTEEAIKMGAKLKEEEKLIDLKYKNDQLIITTSQDQYRTKILIAADGYFSTVRKTLGISLNVKDSPIAIEATIPMDRDEIYSRFNRSVSVHYIPGLFGYAWIFPKKNHISAGLGSFIRPPKSIKNTFFNFLALHHLKAQSKIKSWFLPPSDGYHNLVYDGIMLTGDAAGFVDAFTGEGIRYAMVSGKLAALTAVECFKKRNFSNDCLVSYNDLCNKFIISNLAYSKRISYYIYRYSWFTIPAAFKNKELLEMYANTLFGYGNYKNLISWIKPKMPFIFIKRFLPS